MKCKNCGIWFEKNWYICECPYYARFYKSFKDEEELDGTAEWLLFN